MFPSRFCLVMSRCHRVRSKQSNAFISKSEPITSLLEKVDYLLSLRFLFQPLVGSWADEVGPQHKHHKHMFIGCRYGMENKTRLDRNKFCSFCRCPHDR